MNKEDKTASSDRKHIIIFIIVTAVYLLACAIIYGFFSISHKAEFVKVTPIVTENSGDAPIEKMNINDATLEDLMAVKGIGQSTAQAIIDYRDSANGIVYMDELLAIKGIGEKTLEKIKECFTV